MVNAFVGGMIGIERTVVPLLASAEFGKASTTVALSFIVSFGAVKAVSNLFAGRFSDRAGRKQILVLGWLAGIPVPLLIMFAPSWGWIVFANMLLGVNQGLCWSTTVIMKIDLVGPRRRGFAMGLNEAAGYIAVALAALGSGWLGATYGLRPEPFLLGVVFAVTGLLLSVFAVRETRPFSLVEAQDQGGGTAPADGLTYREIFAHSSWRDRRLFAVNQAGLVNNLNDGMAWGLLPIFFLEGGLELKEIGIIAAVYPAIWGFTQLLTGAWSDRAGRKWLIVSGMWVQAIGITALILTEGFVRWLLAAGVMGLGTAMVYPTLLAAIGDVAHPTWRASAVGVYRLWRDAGYVAGALLAGIVADLLGLRWAIGVVGGLTLVSGVVAAVVMTETLTVRRSNAGNPAGNPSISRRIA